MKNEVKNSMLQLLKIAVITALVYLAFRYLLGLVFPFLIAYGIAVLLNPLLEKNKQTLEDQTGNLKCITGVTGICGGWWTARYGRICTDQPSQKLVQNYDSVAAQGTQVWNLCCQRVEELCGIQNGYVERCVSSYVPMLWQKCRTDVVPKLMNYSIGYVKGFLVGFTIFIVIMVSTILILADYPNIRKKRWSIRRESDPSDGRNMKKAGGTYLKAQLIILLIISSICCVGLFLTGNSYAVLVGCGIGLCDALPFFGTGTVFIPWLLFKVFCGQYLLAGAYGIIYLICNFTREFLEPKRSAVNYPFIRCWY